MNNHDPSISPAYNLKLYGISFSLAVKDDCLPDEKAIFTLGDLQAAKFVLGQPGIWLAYLVVLFKHDIIR